MNSSCVLERQFEESLYHGPSANIRKFNPNAQDAQGEGPNRIDFAARELSGTRTSDYDFAFLRRCQTRLKCVNYRERVAGRDREGCSRRRAGSLE